MQDEVLNLLSVRRGHFLFESGHHGDLWLDLELLCLRPDLLRPLATKLARRLAPYRVEFVCGPLIEGAFVSILVAAELGVKFCYSERLSISAESALFPAKYRVPQVLRSMVEGKRVAIVNDVINAGSAVRGTYADLEECGAEISAMATLLILGTAAQEFATSKGVALESLATTSNSLWTPETCPLCAANFRLEDIAGFRVTTGQP